MNITGILFARPENKVTQEQVLPNLDHWNYRSDYYTEFFCVGFMPFPDGQEGEQRTVVTVGGARWYFSARAFNEVLTELEAQTTWRYRSGCFLIITNSRYDPTIGRAWLDFRHAVVVNIGEAVATGAVDSADELAERLFEFAKAINEGATRDPAWEFSDAVGLTVLRRSLKDTLIEYLPSLGKTLVRRGETFVVQELQPATPAA